MKSFAKLFHLQGIKIKLVLFLVNRVYAGTKDQNFEKKRKLLNSLDAFQIGEGSKIVGPVSCLGKLTVGKDCWIGKNFCVNGNGSVRIGDNCDIGPEVIFQTGGHEIGDRDRRAGEGVSSDQSVGDGTWIGGRVTVVGDTAIGAGCVVAGCACVVKDVPDNVLAGGVPAKIIRSLENEN